MEFFNKLKNKLRLKEALFILLFLLLFCFSVALIVNVGFSSEIQFQLTFGGAKSGIPMPNWLISCFGILLTALFAFCIFNSIKNIKECKEFKKVVAVAETIGGAEAIGTTIAAMEKSKLTKGGDLRYNENLLYYSAMFSADILPASHITQIGSRIERSNSGESVYVCISHTKGELLIKSNKKKALLLIEDLKKTYSIQ